MIPIQQQKQLPTFSITGKSINAYVQVEVQDVFLDSVSDEIPYGTTLTSLGGGFWHH